MSIVSSVTSSLAPTTTQLALPKSKTSNAIDFKQILQSKSDLLNDLGGQTLRTQIQKIETELLHGKTLSAQELLIYQIRAGQYGLRVELISKMSETVSSCWRRLQNG